MVAEEVPTGTSASSVSDLTPELGAATTPKRPWLWSAPSMTVLMVVGWPPAWRLAAAMMSPMNASMAPDAKAASRSCADWKETISKSVMPCVAK